MRATPDGSIPARAGEVAAAIRPQPELQGSVGVLVSAIGSSSSPIRAFLALCANIAETLRPLKLV